MANRSRDYEVSLPYYRLIGSPARRGYFSAREKAATQSSEVIVMDKADELTLLKKGHSDYPDSPEKNKLEVFSNRYAARDYVIEFNCPEFTSLCPITGQPDFARIVIRYIPDMKCIESKSLKLYLFSFRNTGMFHEEITNRILDDLTNACDPRWVRVRGIMNPRGGISIDVTAEYVKPGFESHTMYRSANAER
jgi:7-cyano-7-deazaguanine reductase